MQACGSTFGPFCVAFLSHQIRASQRARVPECQALSAASTRKHQEAPHRTAPHRSRPRLTPPTVGWARLQLQPPRGLACLHRHRISHSPDRGTQVAGIQHVSIPCPHASVPVCHTVQTEHLYTAAWWTCTPSSPTVLSATVPFCPILSHSIPFSVPSCSILSQPSSAPALNLPMDHLACPSPTTPDPD